MQTKKSIHNNNWFFTKPEIELVPMQNKIYAVFRCFLPPGVQPIIEQSSLEFQVNQHGQNALSSGFETLLKTGDIFNTESAHKAMIAGRMFNDYKSIYTIDVTNILKYQNNETINCKICSRNYTKEESEIKNEPVEAPIDICPNCISNDFGIFGVIIACDDYARDQTPIFALKSHQISNLTLVSNNI